MVTDTILALDMTRIYHNDSFHLKKYRIRYVQVCLKYISMCVYNSQNKINVISIHIYNSQNKINVIITFLINHIKIENHY